MQLDAAAASRRPEPPRRNGRDRVRSSPLGAPLHPARARRRHAAGDAAALGIEDARRRRLSSRAAPGSRGSGSKHRSRPAVVHPDEPALRKRAAKELPAELLALAAAHDITVTRVSIRNQRSRWGACSSRGSITLNWRLILVPRVRARVRHDSRADAPPRAESLEAVLAARRRGLSAPPGSPQVAAVGRAAAVHRPGDVLMKRMLGSAI